MTKRLFIANPDATNSELDAKVIIKNQPELTESQRDELTEQFVEIVVDGMDMDSLVQYAKEQLFAYYNEDSIECLQEEIEEYHPELYDELVENVQITDLMKEVS